MFDLIDMELDGPVVRFTFGTPGLLDDGVWRHAAVAEPVISCYESELLPLARESAGAAGAEEIRQRVLAWSQRNRIPGGGFDWLAAALYASRLSLIASVGFANPGATAEMQTDFAARTCLARGLTELFERAASAACAPSPEVLRGKDTPNAPAAPGSTAA